MKIPDSISWWKAWSLGWVLLGAGCGGAAMRTPEPGAKTESPTAAPALPLVAVEADSATARWLAKPVSASRVLDDMEGLSTWSHRGPGRLELATERAKSGTRSLRLTSPTKGEKPPSVVGRPFGESAARRDFPGEDWSEYQRISFWVYPRMPGFKVISLLVKLHNDGTKKVPDSYNREGLNFVLLKPDQWNQVVWEIAHLSRDKVTGLELIYRLQGNEPGATETVQFDFDQLELQKVVPDVFEGWAVAPGRIAYSHEGYLPEMPKVALAALPAVSHFEVLDAATGAVALRKEVAVQGLGTTSTAGNEASSGFPPSAPLREAGVALLDFSELRKPGTYALRLGDLRTRPFPIGAGVWRAWTWKTVNLFFCERCGCAVPGIHDVCHRDWRAEHGGQTMVINGGWHDAGDLSQGLVNTAEAAYAMLALANRVEVLDPILHRRLLEEARWGLDWILKTRFDDGYRMTWATMDYWTDGVVGTVDDTMGEVRRNAYDGFVAAAAEALGARLWQTTDPGYAERCLAAARQDWEAGVGRLENPGVELASMGVLASVELFRATGDRAYVERAVALAEAITRSQQLRWKTWSLPLCGFFYTNPEQRRLLHYNHRGHEQAPAVALAALCEALPDHADWMRWYAAVALHSEYLARLSRVTAPYGMIPASVYRLSDSTEERYRTQVRNGIALDDDHFLRVFPVWYDFRGNSGTILSQAKALSTAARLRGRPDLLGVALGQFEWHLGRNPFAQSLMWGVGHDFAPQYTAMSGDMVGALPVGIQTREDFDRPYWPAANCYNYKETWVHPSSRWLAITADLLGDPAQERETHRESPTLTVTQEPGAAGNVRVVAEVRGRGRHRLALRGYNLEELPSARAVELAAGESSRVEWSVRPTDPEQPWVAVVVVEGLPMVRGEASGFEPPTGHGR